MTRLGCADRLELYFKANAAVAKMIFGSKALPKHCEVV